MAVTCVEIPDGPILGAGWGCCQCRTYNGAQRTVCKNCGHLYCLAPTQKPSQEKN